MADHTLNRITQTHNSAKRIPKSAVFTLPVKLSGGQTLEDGVHTVGLIEGNISISRIVLVVTEAFNGTAPTIDLGDSEDTYFSANPIDVEGVFSSLVLDGTGVTFYKENKTQYDAIIALGGATEGELMFVIEYVQLDTEPGLHTGETAVGA